MAQQEKALPPRAQDHVRLKERSVSTSDITYMLGLTDTHTHRHTERERTELEIERWPTKVIAAVHPAEDEYREYKKTKTTTKH